MRCIVFENEKAFRFLIEHGFVYTLRAYNRSTGVVKLKRSKYGEVIGVVKVELIGNVYKLNGKYVVKLKEGGIKDLEDFAPYSGFKCTKQWLKVFRQHNKRPGTINLYRVTLIELYH